MSDWTYEYDNSDCSSASWYNILKDGEKAGEIWEEEDAILICCLLNRWEEANR